MDWATEIQVEHKGEYFHNYQQPDLKRTLSETSLRFLWEKGKNDYIHHR